MNRHTSAVGVRWLAVGAFIALVGALIAGVVVATSWHRPTSRPPAGPPTARVDLVHRTFHAMGRSCREPAGPSKSAAISKELGVFERFVRDYPDARFAMDDESGSSLSLLFTLRDALETCEPTMVSRVDRLMPREYQKGAR